MQKRLTAVAVAVAAAPICTDCNMLRNRPGGGKERVGRAGLAHDSSIPTHPTQTKAKAEARPFLQILLRSGALAQHADTLEKEKLPIPVDVDELTVFRLTPRSRTARLHIPSQKKM